MAKKHYVSKTPKGLKITRDGYKFTFSWTNGETYKDVDLKLKVNGKPKGSSISYKAGAKDLKASKLSITFPHKFGKTKYTPTSSVSFTVRGMSNHKLTKKEKKTYDKVVESAYANWVTYTIKLPSKPVVGVTWNGEDDQNTSTFTVNVDNTDKANPRWFHNFQWRWVWQAEGDPSESADSWNTNTNASMTIPYEETRISKAFKRKLEAYSVGQLGNSGVAYAEHIYSKPNDPENVQIITASEGRDGINVSVSWSHTGSYWHPIDKTECQYAISPPAKGMAAPKNLDGTAITTHTHHGGQATSVWTDGDSHEIDKNLEVNECLFVRVKFLHDAEPNFSPWVRATQLKSTLSSPSNFSLGADLQDNILRVNAVNTAEDAVEDSFIAVYYKSSQGDGKFTPRQTIGIMPHGGHDYIYVYLPSDPYNPPTVEKIGIQAIAYAFTDKDFKRINVTADNYDILEEDLYYKSGNQYIKVTSEGYEPAFEYYAYFDISVKSAGEFLYKEYTLPVLNEANSMQSSEQWQEGDFPKPPANFGVVSASSNTAKATWDWSWNNATNMELAWSSSPDAWESTEEPSMYRVPVFRAKSWYVKGLDSGEVWYIRGRFIRVNPDDTETIGPWSKAEPLNLTAPPLTPELSFSTNVATENQDVIASWVYTSGDGKAQSLAEIFLFTSDFYGDRPGYYRPAVEKLLIDPETGLPVFDDSFTYYTFNEVYTKVTEPDPEELDSYYIFDDTTAVLQTEINSTVQQITFTPHELQLKIGADRFQLGNIYYFCLRLTSQSSATSNWSNPVQLELVEPLEPPVVETSASSQFIPEVVNDIVYGNTYSHTADTILIEDKDYYLVSGVAVDVPVVDDLDIYYEKDNDIYVKTQDQDIVEGKTYYYLETDMVLEPIVEDLPLYYELDYTVVSRAYLALKSLPITVNVTGAGENGTTIVSIERYGNFFADKPDESIDKGYDGEVVALLRVSGEGEITITKDDLIGSLDDEADYKIVSTIIDANGQVSNEDHIRAVVDSSSFNNIKSILFTRTEEKPYVYTSVENDSYDSTATYYYKNVFTVSWSHQPVKPSAEVEIDEKYLVAKITAHIPDESINSGYVPAEGDTIDIYRLSVDKPQLIVSNGAIGVTYVDPYPAFGEFGGHRVVYKTVNNDYITAPPNKTYSWVDLDFIDGDVVETPYSIINFEGRSVEVLYNIELSSSWNKDFKETKYLGGHVQGDWTPGVSRTGTIGTVSVITQDQETIKNMRRLADYAGIAHVRTRDGSSYSANTNVSENMSYSSYELANYSLSITRVDSESLDGMTLDAWNKLIAMQEESEIEEE